jgi:DNA-binding NtrC family response regulator
MSSDASPMRVLVVDDETSIADSLSLILQARGHRARVAYSAEEAILISDEFVPQALISDVVMPGMNGLDLAAYFDERYPACKVLLISGNAIGFGLVEESVRRGHYHSILPKPIHPTQILQFLATCVSAA